VPAKDYYHDAVIRSLEKDGWTIEAEQVRLELENRWLWIDMQAVKSVDDRAILIEVKGFQNMASPVDYLAAAVGKYVLYRAVLEYLQIEMQLYMAVPIDAYHGILSEEIGLQVIQRTKIHLMTFDPVEEVVVQWIS
jgi:hypothetical protein